jgi:hypothetical protein
MGILLDCTSMKEPVRAELVEAQLFFGPAKKKGFDRLSPNGKRYSI